MKIFTLLLFLGFQTVLLAQHNPYYSQFMFNRLAINPAVAGSQDALSLAALYRHQWEGIEGAPRTATVSAHMPMLGDRIGAGLQLISDRIGMLNTNFATLSYAYRVPLLDGKKIVLGVQTQFEHTRYDWSMAEITDVADSQIPFDAEFKTTFNVGLGIYYYSPEFYIGVSIPQMMGSTLYNELISQREMLKDLRSYYLMGGLMLDLNSKVSIHPSFLVSYSPNAPFELDANVSFIFLKTLSLGASYRLHDSASAILQYKVNPQWRVGVAADLTLSELRNYTAGSLELMMEYLFRFDKEEVRNVRFF